MTSAANSNTAPNFTASQWFFLHSTNITTGLNYFFVKTPTLDQNGALYRRAFHFVSPKNPREHLPEHQALPPALRNICICASSNAVSGRTFDLLQNIVYASFNRGVNSSPLMQFIQLSRDDSFSIVQCQATRAGYRQCGLQSER